MYNSAYLDSKNQFWTGTVGALTMTDLDRFQISSEPPKNVQLTHISVNLQFIDFRSLKNPTYRAKFTFGKALSQSFDSVASFYNYPLNLRLPHDINTLTFHLSAIDWYAPHKIQYRYYLEGADNDWSDLHSENRLHYRNLSHGKYILRVKATGAGNTESDEFVYNFTILSSLVVNAMGKILLFTEWFIVGLLDRTLANRPT